MIARELALMRRDPAMIVFIASVVGLGTAFAWFCAAMFCAFVVGWHDMWNGAYPAVFDATRPVEFCGGLLGATIAICLIAVPTAPRRLVSIAVSIVLAEGLVLAGFADRLLNVAPQ